MSRRSSPSSKKQKPFGRTGRRTRPEERLFSRVAGIFETRVLFDKIVAVAGLGTGGALCADVLARCGVRRWRLFDPDTLELHNLARHTCGMADVGRPKVEAVADRVRAFNPQAEVTTYPVDIVKKIELFEDVISECDIVLVCTDNNASRYACNESCLRRGVPALYAGAFERAFGGQVIRVVPGATSCYDCVFGALQEAVAENPVPHKGHVAYSEITDPAQFKAEPGLCIDVYFIALIQAKMALLTLLRGEGSSLEDFPCDFVLWGNRKEWIFPDPLYARFVKTNVRHDCPTHRKLNVADRDRKKAQAQIERLVSDAACAPDLFRE